MKLSATLSPENTENTNFDLPKDICIVAPPQWDYSGASDEQITLSKQIRGGLFDPTARL